MADHLTALIAGVIAAHEPIGGGYFCSCTPVDADGTRESLPVSFEWHVAEAVATLVHDHARVERAANDYAGQIADSMLHGNVYTKRPDA